MLEVKESSITGAGQGLFACQDFTPGDVVVSLERPLVSDLEIDRMKDTCGWCFQRGATDPMERMQAASMGLPNGIIEIKECKGCCRVGYCSKLCQSKAWKREHKYECKVLARKGCPDLPWAVRAVVKLLGRLEASSGDEREELLDILKFQPTGGDGTQLNVIRTRNKQKFDDFNFLGYGAWHYAGRPVFDDLDGQTVAKGFLANVMSNGFDISSPLDSGVYGSGFDNTICAANHSCDPNVVRVSNQPKTLLRAVKPIKKGDEIFMTYTETSNPYCVRQAALEEMYFFTCQCSKCTAYPVSPEDTFAKRPQDLSEDYCTLADKLVKSRRAELAKFMIGTDESRAQLRLAAMQACVFDVSEKVCSTEEQLLDALKLCIHSGMWTWTRQPVPEICRRLVSKHMNSGSVLKPFKLLCKLHFDSHPVLYPQPFSAQRVINAWALYTMVVALSGPGFPQARDELAEHGFEMSWIFWGFMFELREHTPQMYGWDSPFGKVIDNTYQQAKAHEDLSEAEIKDKLKEVWPEFQNYIRGLDIISVCEAKEGGGCSVM
ncbi:hypothetical protein GGR54DRAFT_486177 [Hypoxylon sp. NC1633]|nr:hypothetical protein GGR54DRAFT_486177 [Hypoxylon sp. NC1633]